MLVIVSADPRRSDRALEALRMSVGLALGELGVRILLVGGAAALLEPEETAYPDWPRGAEYLEALEKLGARVEPGEETPEVLAAADVVIRWRE